MKSPSLESRLVLLQLAVAGTVIVVFAVSSVWLTARALDREATAYLKNQAAQIAKNLAVEVTEEPNFAKAAAGSLEDVPPGMWAEIVGADGRVVARSGGAPAPDAGAPPEGWSGRVRHAEVPFAGGVRIVALATAEADRRALAALVTALAIGALPLFLATLAVSRALARRALWPLLHMSRQIDRSTQAGQVERLGRETDPAEVETLARAFNALVAKLDALLQAERHFTRDAAHELRTPLTVLGGELEHAATDASLTPTQRDALARTREQVRAMSELVEALLLLRRADAVGEDGSIFPLPVNLCDVVREVAAELRGSRPERGADVELNAPDEAFASGDAVLLAAAIRNLLSNALKFTAPGQRVRVAVSEAPAPRNSPVGPRRVEVVVDDAGPGIRPEEYERIFDPFYRDPRSRAESDGFGLGLSLIRRVARAGGGDVVVGRSELGGARFTLSLPMLELARRIVRVGR